MPSNNTHLIQINEVKAHVEAHIKRSLTWFYTPSTGSTNSDLLQHQQPNCIAITESQKQGRGQRNKHWQASSAENLLFSISLNVMPSFNLALTPIKVGLAINSALKQLGFSEIALKWPNDIFFRHKKVGGILIESATQNNAVLLVIGVGLNINMPYSDEDNFIALKQAKTLNRTPLLISLLNAIFDAVLTDVDDVVSAFNCAHLFHQKTLQFKQNNNLITGLCQGINKHGQLLIKTKNGTKEFSTGSIVMNHYADS